MLAKNRIIDLLAEGNFAELADASVHGRGIFRTLLSLSYDKESLICWRAIEAIGLIAGRVTKSNDSETRNLVQRLLWMMRDESGNNVGSAPEILGEIVRNAPETFSDIPPIIASFHDEAGLIRGVLRALVRIAEVRPDLCRSSASVAAVYLAHQDACVRAYALQLAGALRLTELEPSVRALVNDGSAVRIYQRGILDLLKVSEIAKDALLILDKEGER